MNHFQRHIVGYATILLGVANVLAEKIESAWPHTAQDWTLLALSAIAALSSTVIAYRAPYGTQDAAPVVPTPESPAVPQPSAVSKPMQPSTPPSS